MHRHPRNILILIGCICQGYSWDNHFVPILFTVIWFLAIRFQRQRVILSQEAESLVLLIAFIVFKLLTKSFNIGSNLLIFLGGNSLFVYQILRLYQPANHRQHTIATLVALMHIGVGTQVIFDFKILAILLASFVIIPKTLFVLASERFPISGAMPKEPLFRREAVGIAVIAVLFFLTFPRVGFQSPSSSDILGAHGRGPLDRKVDMARSGGGDGSDQIIFQVEGDHLGYLKLFALDVYQDTTWSASPWSRKWQRNFGITTGKKTLLRSVKIFNYKMLDNNLPTDGYVVDITGKFLGRPVISGDGSVKISFPLRKNFNYVYETVKSEEIRELLSEREYRRYTEIPAQSERTRQWLAQVTAGISDPYSMAMTLANIFRTEFRYNLGTPDLSRIHALDDFLFKQKEGHCERFASALAVLLRLKGIPTRVAVGYLPSEMNDIGKFYNIRARHAHAWTEVWFKDGGWTIVDATPYGTGIQHEAKTLALTVREWIEYIWYAKIIEFGVYEQQSMYGWLLGAARDFLNLTLKSSVRIIVFACSLGVLVLMAFFGWRHLWRFLSTFRRRQRNQVREARHFYGRMLRILAKQRYFRKPFQTPYEFLRSVEREQHPLIDQIRIVTDHFCDVRYGRFDLDFRRENEIRQALEKISKVCR